MLVFIKDPVNQLLKVQELNLLKMQERNISIYWKRVGRRPVYLKVIFKKGFKLRVALMLKELSTTNEDPPPEIVKLATQDSPYF